MSTTAFGNDFQEVNLSWNNDHAIQPKIIAARIKMTYEKLLIGRYLLDAVPTPTDAVSYIEEQDIIGNIEEIHEHGSLPFLEFTHRRIAKPIRQYGAKFQITTQEALFGNVNTIDRKIEKVAYHMRFYEDAMIFNHIVSTPGTNEIATGTNWTITEGLGAGDPIADLEQAKRLIYETTYSYATDVIMSPQMYELMTRFEFVRNKLYNSSSFVETGRVPSLVGLNIIIDQSIDPFNEGRIAVLRRRSFGYLAEAIPLTIDSVPGITMGNPQISAVYFTYAMATPIIDAPENITIVSGLRGTI